MAFETENIELLINEFMETVEEINELKESLYSDYQPNHIFRVEIDDFKHIMILFASDLHFGSIFTEYSHILKLWNFILKKDNVYLCVNGDFIDNFDLASVKHLISGINSQIITPELQRDLFVKFISALTIRNKLIACVLGNHELFSHQFPYFKMLQNIPVASNRMMLNLKLCCQSYKIAMIHKSRFNSIFNPLHSNYRELTVMYPDADIVVTSHTHLPAMSILPYPNNGRYLERILLKTGTLKVDYYTTSNFSHPPILNSSIPCVVLNPIQRKMIPFLNYEDAYRFMLISNP